MVMVLKSILGFIALIIYLILIHWPKFRTSLVLNHKQRHWVSPLILIIENIGLS